MGGCGHRAQLLVFLAAVLAPCAAVIALGVRIVDQDRQLRAKRQSDERQRIVGGAASQLVEALETIRGDEVRVALEPGQRYRREETVFVAWSDAGHLALPWEAERDLAAR
ncbi:MAG TPA: hypothetical protein VGS58_01800, partial [Candidatus Sulfopaludibacter sp.]|nr:hypothetical protein [Candidatus Sulfopaludibacter sp.]